MASLLGLVVNKLDAPEGVHLDKVHSDFHGVADKVRNDVLNIFEDNIGEQQGAIAPRPNNGANLLKSIGTHKISTLKYNNRARTITPMKSM